ncbi:MAG: glycosyltransferase [Actinomycetota bacterium]|nr:glycosyltransferase [Actinomycetota bacterium]MDQ2956753.1 glycosyltransferase [Actinomycetota bacterium]
MDSEVSRQPSASIVIPAHNEAAGIARLLTGMLAGASAGEFQILVVCNGCTDRTAAIAAGIGPDVTVIEIEQPSKRVALARGDEQAGYLPRIYLDADLELGAADLRALIAAVAEPGVLAAGPTRSLPRGGVSWPVRAYYGIWEQLPQVRTGLFGRGVIALSEQGHQRVQELPPAMSDDLAISEAFSPAERRIVESASVVIRPPRTVRDLLRRRIRVNTGNAQLDQRAGRGAEAKTGLGDLLAMVRRRPANLPGVLVFLSVAVASRLAARRRIRRGDYDSWLRDESSRQSG